MKDIIDYKVNVFISSKCGDNGRYDKMRKNLKKMIEETNLAKAYVFELSTARSQQAISHYLRKVDDSDICIFLIDNNDGAPAGVINEQKRARANKIKSIYLFCDENEKKATQMQQEIIQSNQEKFYIVNTFSDFDEKAFESLLNDIIDIYRSYCHNYLIDKEFNDELQGTSISSISVNTINRDIYKGFDKTKRALINSFYHSSREIKETSELDILCEKLMWVVLCKDKVKAIKFPLLISELKTLHKNDCVLEFVSLRWNAIEYYFKGKINECVTGLKAAYKYGVLNSSIPNWLIIDILIDLRNMENLLLESQSKIYLDNPTQKLLNENPETAYYPLIDRFETNAWEKLLTRSLKEKTDSPYTTNFGGIDDIFESIASAYSVAFIYGSLTHILNLRNNLADILSHMCFIYSDHSFFIEAISNFLLSQKDKDLEKLRRAYNRSTDVINMDDVLSLYETASRIPIKHKRFSSKLIVLKHFGYYMSDDLYASASNELLSEIEKWTSSKRRNAILKETIFKTLIANIKRIDNDRSAQIVINVFNNKLLGCYENVLKIAEMLNYDTISRELTCSISKHLKTLIEEQDINKNIGNFDMHIIRFRKKINEISDICLDFDCHVELHMPSFFDSTYQLEVLSQDPQKCVKSMNVYIEQIKSRNATQGRNGLYGFGSNPYEIIQNIIKYDKLTLDWLQTKPIIDAIQGTVFVNTQTIDAKNEAIKLFVFLRNKFPCINELFVIYKEWRNNTEKIIDAREDMMFEKLSIETIKFNLLMLDISFGINRSVELISAFATINQCSDCEIIESLKCIERLFTDIDFTKISEQSIAAITQYVIEKATYTEYDVRYFVMRVLILLCHSSYGTIAAKMLSKMMDSENDIIKSTILDRIDVIKKVDFDIAEFIIQKGLADNHYLVRDWATKMKISVN